MARGTTKSTPRRGNGMSYTKWGYIFVAPFCIVYLIFSLYPLISTFIYSTANMKATTAEFWGFNDKEVYYDRYLDMTGYSDLTDAGIDEDAYNRVRDYFDVFQKNADSYKPLKESGVAAIVNYQKSGSADASVYSAEAANAVQEAYDKQDFNPVIPYYDELLTWYNGYENVPNINRGNVSTVFGKINPIVNAEGSGDEEGSESTAITAEDIINSEDFVAFVESLESTDFNAGQVALLDYLSAYLTETLEKDYTVASFFKDIQSGDISLEEPAVYYVSLKLDKTNLDFTPDVEGAEKVSSKIPVAFIGDLESYLSASTWKETIKSLSTFDNMENLASGEDDIHDAEADLKADYKILNAAGIVDIEPLTREGDAIVVNTDIHANKIAALDECGKNKHAEDHTATLAAMQISAIKNFYENTSGVKLIKFQNLDIDIYSKISYNGEVDIAKYNEVKAALGLSELLNWDAYQKIDENRKNKNIAKAQEALAEAQELLPAAQATYDEAVATGDKATIDTAYNGLRTVQVAIDEANDTIKNPDGLLQKAAAKNFYIFTGMENYSQIFNNRARLNTVVGAFASTAIMWLIGFAPQILLALLLSAWFTDTKLRLKGLGLMKALMYLPNVITSITIAIFFRRLFIFSSGGSLSASQILLRACGMENGYNFFESAWATRFIVCFINFWMWYGNTMITLIAGITSISTSLYEAAQIDGANSFQTYTKITMPLLRPMLLYTLVTSLIGGLQMFDIPQNINRSPALIDFNGTMIQSTRTVMMYINTQAFGVQQNKQVGIASAVAVLLFISTTILSIIIFYLMRDKDAEKAKKLAKKAKGGNA